MHVIYICSESSGEAAAKSPLIRQTATNGPPVNDGEDDGDEGGDPGSAAGGGGGGKGVPRRSSVVVIPPMQVCPGDLLVYSKALTHRSNFNGKSKNDPVSQSPGEQ